MRVQWFVVDGVPHIGVTADTRIMCMRLAFEIGSALPGAIPWSAPRKDHGSMLWTQCFVIRGSDCEQVARAIQAAVQVASAFQKGTELTPPMGTAIELLERTK